MSSEQWLTASSERTVSKCTIIHHHSRRANFVNTGQIILIKNSIHSKNCSVKSIQNFWNKLSKFVKLPNPCYENLLKMMLFFLK